MATRKAQESQVARDMAEVLAIQKIRDEGQDEANDDVGHAQVAVAAFPYAEFETTTAKVAGKLTTFRRVVLTSEWEILADQPQAE